MAADLDALREDAARSQSVFRDVNERVEATADSTTFITFVCECSNRECDVSLSLTLEEYERIRADPNRFAVARGHEDPAVEDVVEVDSRYLVVSKTGIGTRIAEHLHPRRRKVARAGDAPPTTRLPDGSPGA